MLDEREFVPPTLPDQKPRLAGKRRDRSNALEMGIEDHFGHRQNSSRLERVEDLGQRSLWIGDLAKHSNQQRTIEIAAWQAPFSEPGLHESNIAKPRCSDLLPRSVEHSRLNVDRDHHTRRADAFGDRNGQTPRPTPGIEDRHALLKSQMFDDERRTVGLGEGIIQFDQPMEPRRARQLATTRSESPDDADGDTETDDGDEKG